MANLRKEFSKIYDKHIEKIFRFIFVKVNSQDIAQDLCSETFLKCWQAFQIQKIDNPQAFLYKIARNLVTDYYRERGRTQVVSTEFASIIDPSPGIETRTEIASDIDQIKIVIANLKEDYQNVIVLRYLDDLSIPEIAKIMDRSEQATRVLLHRALKALRGKVEET